MTDGGEAHDDSYGVVHDGHEYSLESYGWSTDLAAAFTAAGPAMTGLLPGRVLADYGTTLRVATPAIETAELSGKIAHYSAPGEAPKVGDWVGIRPSDHGNAVVELVLPRRNEFVRKVAGKRAIKQVIAANVDMAFVILSLDADFSLERLKRYLFQLTADRIETVIVLNKVDGLYAPTGVSVAEAVEAYLDQLNDLQLPVVVCSALRGTSIDEIRSRIAPQKTAVLLGSSGVGKSTLTNRLLGREVQPTQPVRATDATGQHTTVHRELFMLPNGGMLIDTPGIRELQLWGDQSALEETFDDIAKIASECKYATCQHRLEPDCAIRLALHDGRIDTAKYANYQKMKTELVNLDRRNQVNTRKVNKKSRKSAQRQASERLLDMTEDDR